MRLVPQPNEIHILDGFTSLREIEAFETDNCFGDEEYELIISSDKITAKARGEKGFFYAKKTLKQMCFLYEKIPCAVIRDKPRYTHRGIMIDCARHMFSTAELKKMIDVAADFKFNKLHWHLSDDQGFRIELNCFPELTEKGSVRKCDSFINCKSDKKYSGYYTKTEIKEIVEYAKNSFIDVIPELDMPGHQSAFLHVFPQFTCTGEAVEVKTRQGIFKDIICAGNAEAEITLKKIIDELCELFPYEYFHIGGDEVPKDNWKKCEKCQKIMAENNLSDENALQCFFINKMADHLKNKGKKCIVWNDCLKGEGLSSDISIQQWQGTVSKTSAAANNGHKIILSSFSAYYVDYPYGMHPLSGSYNFEPESFKGLDANGKKNIMGVESPIWTEHINNNERLEYMCFPRWFAVAETGWTDKKNKDYKEFYRMCKKLCDIYRAKGVNCAPESAWKKKSPVKRLKETISFFLPKKL